MAGLRHRGRLLQRHIVRVGVVFGNSGDSAVGIRDTVERQRILHGLRRVNDRMDALMLVSERSDRHVTGSMPGVCGFKRALQDIPPTCRVYPSQLPLYL